MHRGNKTHKNSGEISCCSQVKHLKVSKKKNALEGVRKTDYVASITSSPGLSSPVQREPSLWKERKAGPSTCTPRSALMVTRRLPTDACGSGPGSTQQLLAPGSPCSFCSTRLPELPQTQAPCPPWHLPAPKAPRRSIP